MKRLTWLIAVAVIAGIGPGGMAPAIAGNDAVEAVKDDACSSCTARHETVVRRSAEKYLKQARELRDEDPAEALRLARLAAEFFPELEGARELVVELEAQ